MLESKVKARLAALPSTALAAGPVVLLPDRSKCYGNARVGGRAPHRAGRGRYRPRGAVPGSTQDVN
jgi:hypothetical protein